jgi:hypothetical protein
MIKAIILKMDEFNIDSIKENPKNIIESISIVGNNNIFIEVPRKVIL